MELVLTLVTEVVGGRGKDLHGAGEVEDVKLGVQGDEHVNGLISHSRSLVHTHFDGIDWVVFEKWENRCSGGCSSAVVWSRESIG